MEKKVVNNSLDGLSEIEKLRQAVDYMKLAQLSRGLNSHDMKMLERYKEILKAKEHVLINAPKNSSLAC